MAAAVLAVGCSSTNDETLAPYRGSREKFVTWGTRCATLVHWIRFGYNSSWSKTAEAEGGMVVEEQQHKNVAHIEPVVDVSTQLERTNTCQSKPRGHTQHRPVRNCVGAAQHHRVQV